VTHNVDRLLAHLFLAMKKNIGFARELMFVEWFNDL
jgi:hypothetical protein